jgi:putative ABC transport system permease protein
MATPLPLDAYNYGARVLVEGYTPRYENERISVGYSIVGPTYFQAMSTPVVEGRAFSEYDNEKSPRVVIINETMARRYWPGQNPIGRRLQMGKSQSLYLEIIGIAKDGKYNLLGEPPTEYMFVPFLQSYDGKMTLIARTHGQTDGLAAAIRQEVASLDSEMPVYGIKTMPRFLDRILSGPKSIAALVSIFGLVALMMAAVGLYGVMTYSVTRRTREIGIRMALGARQRDVVRLVVYQGLRLASVGLTLGLAASLFLTRLMSGLLFSVSTADPVTYAAVSLMLVGVSLSACFIPARRATKVDPMIALRQE